MAHRSKPSGSVSMLFCSAFAWVLAGILPACPAMAANEKSADKAIPRIQEVEIGNTKPVNLRPVEAHFQTPGLIKAVAVKKGDVVKTGQVLMTLDDAVELAELEVRTKDANDAKVQASIVNAEAKQLKFNRIKGIHDSGAQNDAEFDEAKAELRLAEISIVSEKQDLEVKKSRVKQQQVKIDQLTLRCPVDGVILSVDAYAGEMGDPTKSAVKIVDNTRLVVVVDLPTAVSLTLKIGQTLRVSYDRKTWKEATVSYLAPMANAGAGMQTVHLDLSNPEGQVSGLLVVVELPEAQVAKN